jgi:CubicO group peptidase (beta-lactamase class C family)
MDSRAIEDAFQEAVDRGVFPGAVVLVGKADTVVFQKAFGSRSLQPVKSPMQSDTIFDLGSLTKPLATTTALMLMVEEGKIRLDDRVTRFFPPASRTGNRFIRRS